MLTSINNKPKSPNFTARYIANTKNIIKNVETEIKLYELSPKHDKHFLKSFDVDLENLMHGLAKYNYERWHEMLELAKLNSLKTDRQSFLAANNRKPCGLIAFLPGKNTLLLDCICTWPTEYGQKVNLAGTTLFQQLFKIFIGKQANKIKLEAITNGPYDTVSKYKKLGFQPISSYYHKVLMETNSNRVKQVLKTLDKSIDYTEIVNPQEGNLSNFIEI